MSAPEKSMEVDYLSKVIVGPGRLPDNVHLQSPSLELVNNTDQHVAFRFKRKGGILHAKSTHTIVVGCTDGVILECSISGDRYVTFKDQSECNEFFEEAKEMGNVVHELALEGIFTRQGETPFPAIPPITKIIVGLSCNDFAELCALDVHPTDRLILTGYESGSRYSEVRLHNYDTPDMAPLRTVCGTKPYCVKFVAQKQQFVAGTSDGFIHVYNYGRGIQKIISFKSADYFDIRLADHSTKSYVSSLSAGPIKLWGWNKGSPNLINENTDWKCTQTFEAVQYCLEWPAVFNPKDTNCFVVASDDFTIKVSYVDSPTSNYTLSGHSDKVNCLEFFKRNDQHYLITGSNDCTAKIWDLQKKTCVHTLRAFMSPVHSVVSLRDLPYLILSSEDGIIHIWNSRNSRLERMVTFATIGNIPHLYLMGTRRVVIERRGTISFMDIDNEGSAVTSSQL